MNIIKKIRKHEVKRHDPGFKQNLLELIEISNELSKQKKYLQAGLILLDCKILAWGFDDELLFNCTREGIINLNKATDTLAIDSFEGILALHNLNSLIGDFYFMLTNNSGLRESQIKSKEELAFRLIKMSETDEKNKNHYLVNGFELSYDLVSTLDCIYPDYHIDGYQRSKNDDRITFQIPGAFTALKDIQDFKGCLEIAEGNKNLFKSVVLEGWHYAAKGWVNTDESSIHFLNAHQKFAQDSHENFEKLDNKKSGWSSVNVDMWSPYYLSLHFLAKSIEDPSNGKDWLIKAASAFSETGIKRLNPYVVRYELIIRSISKCLIDPKSFDGESVIKEYKSYSRLTGTLESDKNVVAFISQLRETLIGFQEDPLEEIKKGRLLKLADQLNQITFLEKGQSNTIDNVISSEALVLCQGPTSWVYRKLESITNEDLLRKLLLRLFQSLSPIYAQNIHGIVEHGRDILVLKKSKTGLVLKLYQVKVGHIRTADWRVIKPQLEEMMEVIPPDSLELKGKPYDKIGVLAFNGHIRPIVDPKIAGWKEDRLTKLNEKYEIMHLDNMVTFIFSNRLVSEFREALIEFNI